MDLKKLDSIQGSEDGKWLDIIVNGEKVGAKIKLKGVDSKTFKSQANSIRKYVQNMKSKGQLEDKDVMDQKSIDMLAACTVDWEGVDEDGVEMKFNLENAKYVYEAYPIIADQVAAFVMDRTNFLEL